MKKTYISPSSKQVMLASISILATSWDPDDRGGIDNKPGSQDDFGTKGNELDNFTPWYRK